MVCRHHTQITIRVDADFAVNVFMPKDRVTTSHQGYGFVEFQSEEDADYAMKIMNMVRLFGKPVKVNKVCDEAATRHLRRHIRTGIAIQARSVHWRQCLRGQPRPRC